MFRKLFISLMIFITAAAVGATVYASTPEATGFDNRQDATDLLRKALSQQLSRRIPGARIELTGSVRWVQGKLPAEMRNPKVHAENARGELEFTVENENGQVCRGIVGFAAWVPARVAIRKIAPTERLSSELFVTQDVNIASGSAREVRALILPGETDVSSLETRQTILEGQYLLSSAVQRVPDVRRGDVVRVHLISNGLTLSTTGVASEPAYNDGKIRVMANKTKRELSGKLLSGGIVEVRL